MDIRDAERLNYEASKIFLNISVILQGYVNRHYSVEGCNYSEITINHKIILRI